MEVENTKNGWEPTSRDLALFTKRQHPTVPTRTVSRNERIERSWKGSNQPLRSSISTKGYGWKSRIRWYTSKIAVQQQQSQLRPTSSGTARNRTSLISGSLVQQPMCTFRRRSASNSTLTLTRGL